MHLTMVVATNSGRGDSVIADLIARASSELPKRPLVAIDYVLDGFGQVKGGDKLSRASRGTLARLFWQAVLADKDATSQDAVAPVAPVDPFSGSLSPTKRRLAAICLIRLLPRNAAALGDMGLEPQIFALLDAVLSNDVYPQLGLETKEQNYKKEQKLSEVPTQLERDIADVIGSLASLNVLSSVRKAFMKEINRTLVKAVVVPFLPRALLGPRLDELFAVVEEYLQADGPTLLGAFKKADETLRVYSAEAERYGTTYSCQYLSGLAERFHVLIRARFEGSAISKPGKLTADRSEKKYPFHVEGKHFSIGFIVKNEGPGHAFDVYFRVTEATDLDVRKPETYLGDLEPTSVIVEVPVISTRSAADVAVSVELRWSNFDKTPGRAEFLFGLERQRSDVDWENLSLAEPYSLEPVETEAELAGRKEILDLLLGQATAKSLGSSYISGQKRVGKTSIVKTLRTHLQTTRPKDFLVLYFERGDYACPDATSTVASLGGRMCQEITNADPRFKIVTRPSFSDALSPLTEFLDFVIRLAPDFRALFILDEFDELPVDSISAAP